MKSSSSSSARTAFRRPRRAELPAPLPLRPRLAAGAARLLQVSPAPHVRSASHRPPTIFVVRPGGADAGLLRQLRAERPADDAGRWRRSAAWLARRRHKLTRFVFCGVVVIAIFLAAFAVNIGGGESSSSHSAIGSTAVAEAGCPGGGIADTLLGPAKVVPGVGGYISKIEDSVNGFCDYVDAVAKDIAGSFFDSIGNFFGKVFSFNSLCGWRVSFNPEDPNTGFNGEMTKVAASLQSKDVTQHDTLAGLTNDSTTWERYGSAGLTWNTYFLNCYNDIPSYLINFMSNAILGVGEVFAVIAIVLFEQTFNGLVINYFLQKSSNGSDSELENVIHQLNINIYVEFAALAVVIGAAVLFWRGVILRRGAAEVVSKFIVMVAISGFATYFFNSHGVVTDTVNEANTELNGVGETIISALTGTDCSAPNGLEVTDPGARIAPYSCAAETMYQIMMFYPWAAGEVGVPAGGSSVDQAKGKRALTVLQFQAYSRQEAKDIDNAGNNRSETANNIDKKKRENRLKFVTDDPPNGLGVALKDGGKFNDQDKAVLSGASWDDVEAKDQNAWKIFSGGNSSARFIISIMALFAMIVMSALVATAAIVYMVLELLTISLLMVLPIILLVGLIPDFGVKIVLRWLEILASAFIKRLGVLVFVCVFLACFRMIFKAGAPWWGQILMVVALIVVGIAYRRKLTAFGLQGVVAGAGAAAAGSMGAMNLRRGTGGAVQTWRESKGMAPGDRLQMAANTAFGASQEGQGAKAQKMGTRVRRGKLASKSSGAKPPVGSPKGGKAPGGKRSPKANGGTPPIPKT